MRPWRLAGPARAASMGWPVMVCSVSTMSPTAKMSGSTVRMWASVTRPPLGPTGNPACLARAVLGRTPTAITTRSAVSTSPLERLARICPPHPQRIPPPCPGAGYAVVGHVVLQIPRHFPIQGGHDLIHHFHHMHLQAAMHQVFRHFHANVAAANDNGPLGIGPSLAIMASMSGILRSTKILG
jgi:hypothetical protein